MPDNWGLLFQSAIILEGACFVTRHFQLRAPPQPVPWAPCSRKLLPRAVWSFSCPQLSSRGNLGCRASTCTDWAPALLLRSVSKTGLGTWKRNQHKPSITLSENLSFKTEIIKLKEILNCKMPPGQSTVRPEPHCAQDTLQLSLAGNLLTAPLSKSQGFKKY